jgi:hypothetical protein
MAEGDGSGTVSGIIPDVGTPVTVTSTITPTVTPTVSTGGIGVSTEGSTSYLAGTTTVSNISQLVIGDANEPITVTPTALDSSKNLNTDAVNFMESGTIDGMSHMHRYMNEMTAKMCNGTTALLFVPELSKYSASYPGNLAYTTSAGHEVECDNTGAAPRYRVSHKSGTTLEVHPDGKSNITAVDQIQIICAKDIHTKAANSLSSIDKDYRVQSTNTLLESSEQVCLVGENVQINSGDTVSISGLGAHVSGLESAVVSSAMSSSLTSTLNCEMTARGGVAMITAGTGILLTAPYIQLLGGGSLVSISPGGIVNFTPGAMTTLSTTNLESTAAASTKTSGTAVNTSGTYSVVAGMVTLN